MDSETDAKRARRRLVFDDEKLGQHGVYTIVTSVSVQTRPRESAQEKPAEKQQDNPPARTGIKTVPSSVVPEEYLISRRNIEVCRRAETFEKNGWRTSNRPDFQTPFAFAEAGFECIGSDTVTCKRCNRTFSNWNAKDVPMTEHRRIPCPFVSELEIAEIKRHPHVKYACANDLCPVDRVVAMVKQNPNILNEPRPIFLCALVKASRSSTEQWTSDLCSIDRAVSLFKQNPNILNEPLEKFLCALIKSPSASTDDHWAELMKKYQDEIKKHPHVRYVCDNSLYPVDKVVAVVQQNPNILNEPLDKFLCAMIRAARTSNEEQWVEMMKKYPVLR